MTMLINHHQFSLDTPERNRLWEERRRHFKDYCVNRYQWFSYPKWLHVAPFPLHVDFEASFRCNLRCPMCFRPHIEKQDHGDMDFALYAQGIDECAEAGLYSIRLSWRGESTMNPRLPDMIEYAKSKGIKEVSFISNGYRLHGELARDLIRAGLDYLTVSVDGLEHHYNELRKPSDYASITEKLRDFHHLKNDLGGFPRLKIQAIWTYIKEDPVAFYNHFKDITDLISFDPENDYSVRDVPQDPGFVCQYPWQRITVTWDGEMPMCISDWNMRTSLGRLGETSIREAWLGQAMRDYRAMQTGGRRLEIDCCRRCHRPSTEQIGDIPQGDGTQAASARGAR